MKYTASFYNRKNKMICLNCFHVFKNCGCEGNGIYHIDLHSDKVYKAFKIKSNFSKSINKEFTFELQHDLLQNQREIIYKQI